AGVRTVRSERLPTMPERGNLMLVHRSLGRPLLVVLAGALAALALIGPARLAPAPATRAQAGTVKMEWLGWSHFRFTSPGGKVVLTNPFIEGRPDAADRHHALRRAGGRLRDHLRERLDGLLHR